MIGPVPRLHTDLLRGFRYACRPGCGLCCYAEPRVDPTEKAELLRIAPLTETVEATGASYLRARPEGGACQFLRSNRCSVHALRPHPCKEFPVHVHVGERLQATLVLSCPGVELGTLRDRSLRQELPTPVGLDSELAAVGRRLDPSVTRRMDEARRRRTRLVRVLDRAGRWMEEEEVRSALRGKIPVAAAADYPAEDPPAAEEGLEFLPLYFDGRGGPVGLAEGLGGWEALELRPSGGVERLVGVVPPPASPPALEPPAIGLLSGYLAYFLERDLLFASILPRMAEVSEGTVRDWVEEELRAIGAMVVSRGSVRAKLAGHPGEPLTEADIEAGIRATDQDRLDVPTWGDRL
jgi:Fe-S-cluster containining protein